MIQTRRERVWQSFENVGFRERSPELHTLVAHELHSKHGCFQLFSSTLNSNLQVHTSIRSTSPSQPKFICDQARMSC